MNPISTGLSGMHVASLRLQTSAHNIANGLTPDWRRQSVAAQALPGGGVTAMIVRADTSGASLADDIIEQKSASYAFKANLKVLQTQDALLGSLLDLKA